MRSGASCCSRTRVLVLPEPDGPSTVSASSFAVQNTPVSGARVSDSHPRLVRWFANTARAGELAGPISASVRPRRERVLADRRAALVGDEHRRAAGTERDALDVARDGKRRAVAARERERAGGRRAVDRAGRRVDRDVELVEPRLIVGHGVGSFDVPGIQVSPLSSCGVTPAPSTSATGPWPGSTIESAVATAGASRAARATANSEGRSGNGRLQTDSKRARDGTGSARDPRRARRAAVRAR